MALSADDRIHYEDKQLATRVLAFLTATSFLVIGFATAESRATGLGQSAAALQFAIALLGLFLSYLYSAVGFRNITAIRFWGKYAAATRSEHGLLFDFFHNGAVTLATGATISQTAKRGGKARTVWDALPWKWVHTPNDVFGLVVPWGLAVFWAATTFTVPLGTFSAYGVTLSVAETLVGPLVSVVGFVVFFVTYRSWPGEVTLKKSGVLLAVLGRGVYFDGKEWVPSEDFEVCRIDPGTEAPSHCALPVQDGTPGTGKRLGGGRLNVDAAATILSRGSTPVVLGFGPPAEYLVAYEKGKVGPIEGEPMAQVLRAKVPSAQVIPFPSEVVVDPRSKSDTRLEVSSVFQLARVRGFSSIRFLTISPHMLRVQHFAFEEFNANPRVSFTVESSEGVLLSNRPEASNRVARFQGGPEYAATVKDELAGLESLGD